jgi:CAAX prenyl protease-like protein
MAEADETPATETTPAAGTPAPLPFPLLDPENAPLPKSGWLRRWPAVTYLLPFGMFMLVGMFEPSPPDPKVQEKIAQYEKQLDTGNAAEKHFADEQLKILRHEAEHLIPYEYYPAIYTTKIALTTLAMLAVIPGYLAFPLKLNPIAFAVGLVGGAAWIALAKAQVALYPHLGETFSKWLEMGGRSGFNPLVELKDNPAWAYGFLAIRFFGLVVVVAVIEEFFLRGFLMRYVMDIDWHLIPFAVLNRLGLLTLLIFPVIYHPERLASAVWFSLVTWMMLRTRNIWDCVVAHALTNLVLGLWVVYSGDWWMM